MSDKPIDLGKLQDAHRAAMAAERSASVKAMHAQDAARRALALADKAKKNHTNAAKVVDAAKESMIEAVRTLTNNS